MHKPYEVQADGAAPKWKKYRRQFADKRAAIRDAAKRTRHGLDAGAVVVYDLRDTSRIVASCQWVANQFKQRHGHSVYRDMKRRSGHGTAHARCYVPKG